MTIATISELEIELTGLITAIPSFAKNGFSVFDLDDARAKSSQQGQSLPVVSIAYDGMEFVGRNDSAIAEKTQGAGILAVQFIVIIAIQYQYTGQEDTKQTAFDLLGQVRNKVMGYKGVNSRPWRFIGERPEPSDSGDGVVFYSQVWQTALPIVGTFNS